jgi:hypothetical protein
MATAMFFAMSTRQFSSSAAAQRLWSDHVWEKIARGKVESLGEALECRNHIYSDHGFAVYAFVDQVK